MLRHILLVIGILLACCFQYAAAQKLELSLGAGLQHNLIPDYSEEFDPLYPTQGFVYTLEVDYQEKPTAFLAAQLTYKAQEKLQLYHNLNLNLLRYKLSTKISSPYDDWTDGSLDCTDENGQPISCWEPLQIDDKTGETSILFLTQEIGARYGIAKRWWVEGGLALSYRLYSQQWVQQFQFGPHQPQDGSQNPPQYTMEKDQSGDGFSDVNIGLQLGTVFDLSKNLSLSFTAQQNFNSLYKAEGNYETYKARPTIFSLGARYKFSAW